MILLRSEAGDAAGVRVASPVRSQAHWRLPPTEATISDDKQIPRVSLNEVDGALEIEYPCRWLYKVIGTDPGEIRQAVLETIELEDVTIEPSHTSAKGRFVSFNVEVTVTSTEERTGIYEALKGHAGIRMVL